MAIVRLAPWVLDDLERIITHLQAHETAAIDRRVAGLTSAFDVLADHPLIGRPAGEDRHDLLIGRGASGYLALYRYLPVIDTILILAIRAQREVGYERT